MKNGRLVLDEPTDRPEGEVIELVPLCRVRALTASAGFTRSRTATGAPRAASYLVLSARLGFELPGRLPTPARIKHAPIAYTRALEAADAACAVGVLDVSALKNSARPYGPLHSWAFMSGGGGAHALPASAPPSPAAGQLTDAHSRSVPHAAPAALPTAHTLVA